MARNLEIVEGEIPCPEQIAIVPAENCRSCKKGRPVYTTVKAKVEKDGGYFEDRPSVACSLPERAGPELRAYNALYRKFYCGKAEPEKPMERPVEKRKTDPAIAGDADNPPGLHPHYQNQPD